MAWMTWQDMARHDETWQDMTKHLLEVPNVRLKSYGDRAFSVAAPKHWNEIPLDIKLSR